jgi:hypothetical protein
MLRPVQTFFNQVSQPAACNQFHSVQGRSSRWLLMTNDRMHADDLEFCPLNFGGVADNSASRLKPNRSGKGIDLGQPSAVI